jgi:hypothetical protein
VKKEPKKQVTFAENLGAPEEESKHKPREKSPKPGSHRTVINLNSAHPLTNHRHIILQDEDSIVLEKIEVKQKAVGGEQEKKQKKPKKEGAKQKEKLVYRAKVPEEVKAEDPVQSESKKYLILTV